MQEPSKEELIENNVCPNCWGRQEYDGKFIQKYKDRTISNINKDKLNRKAFIAQFIETYISGILLKSDGNKISCPKCNVRFDKSEK